MSETSKKLLEFLQPQTDDFTTFSDFCNKKDCCKKYKKKGKYCKSCPEK